MAVKFKLVSKGMDALYNVTVNGYYVDGTTRVSDDMAFSFDPAEVSLAGMQDVVSKAQPVVDPAVTAKIAAANAALAKLASYVGTDITLDAPVIPQ